jgi:hypothetical protein
VVEDAWGQEGRQGKQPLVPAWTLDPEQAEMAWFGVHDILLDIVWYLLVRCRLPGLSMVARMRAVALCLNT